ncbi:MAG: hypothetical protein AAF550_07365, partial [Myxococcota bacterium]
DQTIDRDLHDDAVWLLSLCAEELDDINTHRDALGRGGRAYSEYVERRASEVSSCLSQPRPAGGLAAAASHSPHIQPP